MNDRESLVGTCGLDCGICELYQTRDNPQLLERMVQSGIPREKLPCPGCRSVHGLCPVVDGTCETYSCTMNAGVEFCFECADFPCNKLQPSAHRAEVLPHNMKVFNLCTIKRDGVAAFIAVSGGIKLRYYKGQMAIGKGPQV